MLGLYAHFHHKVRLNFHVFDEAQNDFPLVLKVQQKYLQLTILALRDNPLILLPFVNLN